MVAPAIQRTRGNTLGQKSLGFGDAPSGWHGQQSVVLSACPSQCRSNALPASGAEDGGDQAPAASRLPLGSNPKAALVPQQVWKEQSEHQAGWGTESASAWLFPNLCSALGAAKACPGSTAATVAFFSREENVRLFLNDASSIKLKRARIRAKIDGQRDD